MLTFALLFSQLNALITFSLLKIVSLHKFVLLLFTSSRVVAVRLLIMAKTSRHFFVRCWEYLGINKKGLSIKSASSSIRDHINVTGHAASLDGFCILDKANNNFDLLIHESLLISIYPSVISLTISDMRAPMIQSFQELFAFQIPTSTTSFTNGICSIKRSKIRLPLLNLNETFTLA